MRREIEDQNKKLIPLRRLAEISSYSAGYISILVQRKKLKAKRVGRNFFTTKEWFNEYLETHARDAKRSGQPITKFSPVSNDPIIPDQTVVSEAMPVKPEPKVEEKIEPVKQPIILEEVLAAEITPTDENIIPGHKDLDSIFNEQLRENFQTQQVKFSQELKQNINLDKQLEVIKNVEAEQAVLKIKRERIAEFKKEQKKIRQAKIQATINRLAYQQKKVKNYLNSFYQPNQAIKFFLSLFFSFLRWLNLSLEKIKQTFSFRSLAFRTIAIGLSLILAGLAFINLAPNAAANFGKLVKNTLNQAGYRSNVIISQNRLALKTKTGLNNLLINLADRVSSSSLTLENNLKHRNQVLASRLGVIKNQALFITGFWRDEYEESINPLTQAAANKFGTLKLALAIMPEKISQLGQGSLAVLQSFLNFQSQSIGDIAILVKEKLTTADQFNEQAPITSTEPGKGRVAGAVEVNPTWQTPVSRFLALANTTSRRSQEVIGQIKYQTNSLLKNTANRQIELSLSLGKKLAGLTNSTAKGVGLVSKAGKAKLAELGETIEKTNDSIEQTEATIETYNNNGQKYLAQETRHSFWSVGDLYVRFIDFLIPDSIKSRFARNIYVLPRAADRAGSVTIVKASPSTMKDLTITGNLNIGGALNVSGPAEFKNKLKVIGLSEFLGDVVVSADLTTKKLLVTEYAQFAGPINAKDITADNLVSRNGLTVVGGSFIGGDELIAGNLKVAGTFQAGHTEFSSLGVTGLLGANNLSVGTGGLVVSGNTYLDGDNNLITGILTLNNVLDINSDSREALTVGDGTNETFTVDTSNDIVTISATLVLNGDLQFNGDVDLNGALDLDTASTSALAIGDGTNNNLNIDTINDIITLGYASTTDQINLNASQLALNFASSSTGLLVNYNGTGNIIQVLDNGTNRFTMASSGAVSIIASSTTSTALSVTQNDTGDILNLFNNSGEVLTVLSGGNVGIGTSTPAFVFDVFGNARVDGTLKIGAYTLPATDGLLNQVLKTDAAGNLTWQYESGTGGSGSGGWNFITDAIYHSTSTDTVIIGASAITNAENSLEVIGSSYFSTNLGIGTSTPVQELAVSGDFYLTGALYNNLTGAGTNGNILQTTGSATKWVSTSTLGLVTSVGLSVPNGLTITNSPITTSGTLALGWDTGYDAVKTASTTNWNNFYDIPSARISAGNQLSWSGNTLNVLGGSGLIAQLGQIGDVATSAPMTYGEMLRYNTATAKWESVATSTLFTSGVSTLPTGIDGQTLNYQGSTWQATSSLTVWSSGNVGIGTTSPLSKLEIDDVNKALNSPEIGGSANMNIVTTDSMAINLGGTIGFGGKTDAFNTKIFGVIGARKEDANNGAQAGYLQFSTNNSGSLKEWMRITSTGNVGIGLTNPTAKLQIKKATAPTTISFANSYLQLGEQEQNTNSYKLITFGYTNGTTVNPAAYLGFNETYTIGSGYGDLVFGTRSTANDDPAAERLRITSGGNVGIGTSTPTLAKLDVYGDIALENQNGILLYELGTNGVNYAKLIATSSMAANVTWTLPNADGTSGKVLATNGAGNLYWVTPGSTIAQLGQIGDVSTTTLAYGSVLRYNTTTSKWESTGTSTLGLVTSVAMSVPNGLALSGSPITTAGTLGLTWDTGYDAVKTASSTNWNTFYDTPSNRISLSGSTLSWNGNTLTSTATSTNYWYANGNDIYKGNSGNVGIGSTTPGALFSVGSTGQGLQINSTGTIISGSWNGSAITDPYISSATTWNAKQNAISVTYPVTLTGATVGLAFGTSTSNTWGGTQTFNNLITTNATTTLLCFSNGQCMSAPTTMGSSNIVMYHWNGDSDIGGYEQFRSYPDSGGTNIDESCSATSGYCNIDSYVATTTDLSISSIPAGNWSFHYFMYVDSAAQASYVEATVYRRTALGVETQLFQATSTEINNTTVLEDQFSTTQGAFAFDTTDRLVVKIRGFTTSVSAKNIHFLYGGVSNNYSHIETPISIGNFNFARKDLDETITGSWTHSGLTILGNASTTLLSIDSLNGPLSASNGMVTATSSIGVMYGGTGLTTLPNYGQLLLGNNTSGYTLTGTSTLGLVTSVALSTPVGLTISGSPITTNGTLALAWDTDYSAVKTASTTNWNNFYNTPSNRITAGMNLAWNANTLNLSTTTMNLATSSFASGNISQWVNNSGYITLTSLSGNAPISYNNTNGQISFTNPGYITSSSLNQLGQIGDVSTSTLAYGHVLMWNNSSEWQDTATSSLGLVTSVALSTPVGLTISGSPITTNGTLALAWDTDYSAVKTASSTNWNTFYNTPSNRITAGMNLAWNANTLNLSTTTMNLATSSFASGNISQWVNNSGYITLTSLSGTAPIGYNNTTGEISFTNPGYITSSSLNQLGQIGDVSTSTLAYGHVLMYNNSSKWQDTATSSLGLVTSVALSTPVGLTISGSPITTNGTLALNWDTDYSAVKTASTTNWNNFYNTPSNRITAGMNLAWNANTLNLSTTTMNLATSSFASGNISQWVNNSNYITLTSLSGTAPIGYNNTTGEISFTNPGYITSSSLNQLGQIGDVSTSTLAYGHVLMYNNSSKWQDTATSSLGLVTSVALSTPVGLTISGSPITTNGTLALAWDTDYSAQNCLNNQLE
jgi:hypothetical protein